VSAAAAAEEEEEKEDETYFPYFIFCTESPFVFFFTIHLLLAEIEGFRSG
jgi:hypothetical protein